MVYMISYATKIDHKILDTSTALLEVYIHNIYTMYGAWKNVNLEIGPPSGTVWELTPWL
jgi:hypothetical protein